MALMAKEKGGDYTPAPAGNHPARCIAVIDLGTQYSPQYEKHSHKVRIMWELPNETKVFDKDKGPEPYVLGRNFTLSLGRNGALRPVLESWRGRAFTPKELEGFDLKNILGKPCLLNVVHDTKDGKTYAVISAVSGLPKGFELPPQVLESKYWELADGKNEVFNSLPEWIQEMIAECEEWKPKTAPQPDPGIAVGWPEGKPAPAGATGEAPEDDVPF